MLRKPTIRSSRIGLTGAASHALRLTSVEEAVAGQAATAEAMAQAAQGAGAKIDDINADLHASEAYRRAMIQVFTTRALQGALARLPA